MKRIIVLILFCVLFFTACGDKNINNEPEQKEAPYIDTVEKLSEYEFTEKINCPGFDKDILYFNYDSVKQKGWFINSDYDVYEFYRYQLYSNGTNCSKLNAKIDNIIASYKDMSYGTQEFINSDYKFISIVDGNIYQLDNPSYCRGSKTRNDLFCRYENEEYHASILNYLNDIRIKKIQTSPATLAITGTDNYIYGFYLDSYGYYTDENGNVEPTLSNKATEYLTYLDKSEIVYEVSEDEIITDFYITPNVKFEVDEKKENAYSIYDSDLFMNYIVTNKSFYRYKLKDERCLEYVDIDCEYDILEDFDFKKVKDDILYYDEFTVILSNGRVFGNNYYFAS